MAEDSTGRANSIVKTLGGVVAILTVIGAIFTIESKIDARLNFAVDRINQEMTYIQKDIRDLKSETATEKEIKELDKRLSSIEEWRIWWNRNILVMHSELQEKLQNLQKCVDLFSRKTESK